MKVNEIDVGSICCIFLCVMTGIVDRVGWIYLSVERLKQVL